LSDEEIFDETDITKVLSEIVKNLALSKGKQLEQLSELDKGEIKYLSLLLTISDKLTNISKKASETIKNYVYNYLSLSISHSRKARKELVELFRNYAEGQESGFLSRMRQRLGF